MAIDFSNENSGTIEEYFQNISILFKNISDVENITTIDLKGFFLKKKKLNLIVTKEYEYQQEQNSESLSIIK